MISKKIQEAVQSYLSLSGYPYINLKAVLFDMDGVLYNSMPHHSRAWQQTMQEYGYSCTYEEFFLHEGRTGRDTINLLTQREFGREATSQEITEIYERKSYLFGTFNQGEVMPFAKTMVETVQKTGLDIVLVTGSGQRSLLDKLEESFPNAFMPEKMITAYDVVHGKPNPEPYLKGLKKAGFLQPHQALVVENAPMGVQAAADAGIFTVAVNTGPISEKTLYDSGADIVFSSVEEFVKSWDALYGTIQRVYTENK